MTDTCLNGRALADVVRFQWMCVSDAIRWTQLHV